MSQEEYLQRGKTASPFWGSPPDARRNYFPPDDPSIDLDPGPLVPIGRVMIAEGTEINVELRARTKRKVFDREQVILHCEIVDGLHKGSPIQAILNYAGTGEPPTDGRYLAWWKIANGGAAKREDRGLPPKVFRVGMRFRATVRTVRTTRTGGAPAKPRPPAEWYSLLDEAKCRLVDAEQVFALMDGLAASAESAGVDDVPPARPSPASARAGEAASGPLVEVFSTILRGPVKLLSTGQRRAPPRSEN